MLRASERVDHERIPVARRTTSTHPAAQKLLALQRSAGNGAVARLVARSRTLARVAVGDVRAECDGDPEFDRRYRAWLKMKTGVTGATEAELVGGFTLDELKDRVREFATHEHNFELVKSREREAEEEKQKSRAGFLGSIWGAIEDAVSPTLDLRGAIMQELELIAESPTLQKFAKQQLGSLPRIISQIQILEPDAFERKFFETTAERRLDRSDSLSIIDFAKGFTVSGVVCLRLGSGANLSSIHPAVHEAVHALGDPGVPMTFGQNLNEGVTEMITRRVMTEVGNKSESPGFWKVPEAYRPQRQLVDLLLEDPSMQSKGADGLIELYFNLLFGDRVVFEAVSGFGRSGAVKATPILQ